MKNLVKNSLLCLSALTLLAACNQKAKPSGPQKPTFPVKLVKAYFTDNGVTVKIPKLTIADPQGQFEVSEGLMGGPMIYASALSEEEIQDFVSAFEKAGWALSFELMEGDAFYQYGEEDAWVEIMINARFNNMSFDFYAGEL